MQARLCELLSDPNATPGMDSMATTDLADALYIDSMDSVSLPFDADEEREKEEHHQKVVEQGRVEDKAQASEPIGAEVLCVVKQAGDCERSVDENGESRIDGVEEIRKRRIAVEKEAKGEYLEVELTGREIEANELSNERSNTIRSENEPEENGVRTAFELVKVGAIESREVEEMEPLVMTHGIRDVVIIDDYSGAGGIALENEQNESHSSETFSLPALSVNEGRNEFMIEVSDCIDDVVMKVVRKYDIEIPSHPMVKRAEDSQNDSVSDWNVTVSALEEKVQHLHGENDQLMERYVKTLEEKSVIYEENYFLKQERTELTQRLTSMMDSKQERSNEADNNANNSPPLEPPHASPKQEQWPVSIDEREKNLALEEERCRDRLAHLELKEISLSSLERCLLLSRQVQHLEEANRQFAHELLLCKNGKLNEKLEVLKVKRENLDLREERENIMYDRIDMGIKYFRLKERCDELNIGGK
jgi:hypothetical protein